MGIDRRAFVKGSLATVGGLVAGPATADLAAPGALAAAPADLSDLATADVDCGSIFTHGLVHVALCLLQAGVAVAKAGACVAWRLVWGQSAPCLLV